MQHVIVARVFGDRLVQLFAEVAEGVDPVVAGVPHLIKILPPKELCELGVVLVQLPQVIRQLIDRAGT